MLFSATWTSTTEALTWVLQAGYAIWRMCVIHYVYIYIYIQYYVYIYIERERDVGAAGQLRNMARVVGFLQR